jgi:hypothetical protein
MNIFLPHILWPAHDDEKIESFEESLRLRRARPHVAPILVRARIRERCPDVPRTDVEISIWHLTILIIVPVCFTRRSARVETDCFGSYAEGDQHIVVRGNSV